MNYWYFAHIDFQLCNLSYALTKFLARPTPIVYSFQHSYKTQANIVIQHSTLCSPCYWQDLLLCFECTVIFSNNSSPTSHNALKIQGLLHIDQCSFLFAAVFPTIKIEQDCQKVVRGQLSMMHLHPSYMLKTRCSYKSETLTLIFKYSPSEGGMHSSLLEACFSKKET